MRRICLVCLIAVLMSAGSSVVEVKAQSFVDGGRTSVLLDTATLSSVGLNLTGTSGALVGELGANSVAFGINPRNGNLPTTFVYTPGGLAPFSGTIEHFGSVFFNQPAAPLEVGNFTIGFDANRVGGNRSGFFVASTVGLAATLFDVENPSNLNAAPNSLTIAANLLVSPELATVLGNANLAGADVGDALVNATAIPEPSVGFLLTAIIGGLAVKRRR